MSADVSKVGVVEDDEVLREYLVDLINNEPDFEVAFECGLVAEAHTALENSKVDLCLVDLKLPDGTGLDIVEQTTSSGKGKSLILTIFGDEQNVLSALQAGANGYILKDSKPDVIIDHIRSTLNGDAPFSPAAARFLLSAFTTSEASHKASSEDTSESQLTNREMQLLQVFAKGMSYKEAAKILDISPHTVGDHTKAIYRKLGVRSKSEAVFEAGQLGIL